MKEMQRVKDKTHVAHDHSEESTNTHELYHGIMSFVAG